MTIRLAVDLETLGKKAGCPILSMAFVPINRPDLPEYFAKIDPQSCIDLGLVVDQGTVDWWTEQSEEAQKEAFGGTTTLKEALAELNKYIFELSKEGEIEVYGNGATFDNTILHAAYDVSGIVVPWRYWGDLCLRSLYSAFKPAGIVRCVPEIAHSALHDARAQAGTAGKIFDLLKLLYNPNNLNILKELELISDADKLDILEILKNSKKENASL